MDYLNYGKQVQQKPQGFGQEKVQLTKDDFSFGDLSQQTPQPQQAPQPQVEPQKDWEILSLFSIPLAIFSCPFDYSEELEWIKKQPIRLNEVSDKRSYFKNQTLNRQSEYTFLLDKPEMSRVRQFIDSKIKEFVANIMGSDDEVIITQSWTNRSGKGELHHDHKHPNSIISGVWYPQMHEKLPPITFANERQRDVSLSIKRFNNFNSETYMLPIKRGELILFPSNLKHSVPANQSDEERISLSFNTWVKGSLGDERSLTYLPLDRCV